MGTTTIEMRVSDDLVKLLGSSEAIGERAYETLVLDLLRKATISQGKAAELLGISRYAMIQLAAAEKIESGPRTEEDVLKEFRVAEEIARHRKR